MKRRDLIRMSDDEVAEFLRGRHTMNVATINHDGTIHLVAMWYGFVRAGARVLDVRQVAEDPQPRARPPDHVLGRDRRQVRGAARGRAGGPGELVPDHEGEAIGRSVFERYPGEWSDEAQPFLERTGAKRVGVIVHVDRVVSWDHRKLEGQY